MNYGNRGGGDVGPNIKTAQRASGRHSLSPSFQVQLLLVRFPNCQASGLGNLTISLKLLLAPSQHHLFTLMSLHRDLLRVEASCQCLRSLVTGHQLYRASYARLCRQQVLFPRRILYYLLMFYLGDRSLLGRGN